MVHRADPASPAVQAALTKFVMRLRLRAGEEKSAGHIVVGSDMTVFADEADRLLGVTPGKEPRVGTSPPANLPFQAVAPTPTAKSAPPPAPQAPAQVAAQVPAAKPMPPAAVQAPPQIAAQVPAAKPEPQPAVQAPAQVAAQARAAKPEPPAVPAPAQVAAQEPAARSIPAPAVQVPAQVAAQAPAPPAPPKFTPLTAAIPPLAAPVPALPSAIQPAVMRSPQIPSEQSVAEFYAIRGDAMLAAGDMQAASRFYDYAARAGSIRATVALSNLGSYQASVGSPDMSGLSISPTESTQPGVRKVAAAPPQPAPPRKVVVHHVKAVKRLPPLDEVPVEPLPQPQVMPQSQ